MSRANVSVHEVEVPGQGKVAKYCPEGPPWCFRCFLGTVGCVGRRQEVLRLNSSSVTRVQTLCEMPGSDKIV